MNDDTKKNRPTIAEAFTELMAIVHRLRAPGGCPWDRKQTPESLKQYIVEEAYEVIDAIDQKSDPDLCEELGDLLLQVALQADIAEEDGTFDIVEVCRGISKKLIRRHPHVFGDVEVSGSDEVIANWEQIKQKEKNGRGLFEGLPLSLPALQTAGRMGEKAARIGFDWPDIAGVRDKVDEELKEVEDAVRSGDKGEIEHEIGDLLFAVAQWSRHLHIEPEEALRASCGRFKARFALMEEAALKENRALRDMSIDDMEQLWQQAKGRQRGNG